MQKNKRNEVKERKCKIKNIRKGEAKKHNKELNDENKDPNLDPANQNTKSNMNLNNLKLNIKTIKNIDNNEPNNEFNNKYINESNNNKEYDSKEPKTPRIIIDSFESNKHEASKIVDEENISTYKKISNYNINKELENIKLKSESLNKYKCKYLDENNKEEFINNSYINNIKNINIKTEFNKYSDDYFKEFNSELDLNEISYNSNIETSRITPSLISKYSIKKNIDNEPLSEYTEDIFRYFKLYENHNHPNYSEIFEDSKFYSYNLRKQTFLWLIRNILYLSIDILPNTYYLTFNLFDLYSKNLKNKEENLELICMACFFIASKYEEIYYPDIDDIIQFTNDEEVSKTQLLEMEIKILDYLNFDLEYVSAINFIELYYYLIYGNYCEDNNNNNNNNKSNIKYMNNNKYFINNNQNYNNTHLLLINNVNKNINKHIDNKYENNKDILHLSYYILEILFIYSQLFCSLKPSKQAAICLLLSKLYIHKLLNNENKEECLTKKALKRKENYPNILNKINHLMIKAESFKNLWDYKDQFVTGISYEEIKNYSLIFFKDINKLISPSISLNDDLFHIIKNKYKSLYYGRISLKLDRIFNN